MLFRSVQETTVPCDIVDIVPITLDVSSLPKYASRTTLRMLIAIVVSLLFTFIYATLAAKSRRLGMVLIPILDIMQSIPILGFLTFTVIYFISLYPGRVIGAEFAAIFAIFTSQVWNMTFSMYQSLCNIPKDLEEVSRSFRLSGWQKFWNLDVPFSIPGLVWNMMIDQVVIPARFERATTRLGIWCSILLSYEIFILYIHKNLGYTNLLLCLECDF